MNRQDAEVVFGSTWDKWNKAQVNEFLNDLTFEEAKQDAISARLAMDYRGRCNCKLRTILMTDDKFDELGAMVINTFFDRDGDHSLRVMYDRAKLRF